MLQLDSLSEGKHTNITPGVACSGWLHAWFFYWFSHLTASLEPPMVFPLSQTYWPGVYIYVSFHSLRLADKLPTIPLTESVTKWDWAFSIWKPMDLLGTVSLIFFSVKAFCYYYYYYLINISSSFKKVLRKNSKNEINLMMRYSNKFFFLFFCLLFKELGCFVQLSGKMTS